MSKVIWIFPSYPEALRWLLLDRQLAFKIYKTIWSSWELQKSHLKDRLNKEDTAILSYFLQDSHLKNTICLLIKIAWKGYRISINIFSPLSSLTVLIYNKLFANLLSNSRWKTTHHISASTSYLPSSIFLHWKQQQLGRHSGQGNGNEHLVGLTPWQPRRQNVPQMLDGCKQQGAKTTLKGDGTRPLTKAYKSVAQEIHQEYHCQQHKPNLPSHKKPEWANISLFRE